MVHVHNLFRSLYKGKGLWGYSVYTCAGRTSVVVDKSIHLQYSDKGVPKRSQTGPAFKYFNISWDPHFWNPPGECPLPVAWVDAPSTSTMGNRSFNARKQGRMITRKYSVAPSSKIVVWLLGTISVVSGWHTQPQTLNPP